MNFAWISRALLVVCLVCVPAVAQVEASRHYELGRTHFAGRQWAEAEREFRQAIELRPEYVLARLSLAQLLINRGRFDEALEMAGSALQFEPDNRNARLIQTAALMGQKKFDEAQRLLDELLKVAPASLDANFQAGVVNLAQSKYPEAEAAFRRAYQLNPWNSASLMGMVETAMAQGKTEAAMALLQTELAQAPNRTDIRLALGNTAVRAGHYDLAIATYQKLLDQAPPDSTTRGDIYMRIGETYRRMGNAPKSIEALTKARETSPGNVVVLITLALVLDGAGRKAEAAEAYTATLKLDPNNAVALNNYAFLLAETGGDLSDALAKARRAQQVLPNLLEISDTLGWIYLKKGMVDNALEIFRDLAEKQASNPTAHYHLALAYQKKGDTAAALTEAQKALKSSPAAEERKKIEELIAELDAK